MIIGEVYTGVEGEGSIPTQFSDNSNIFVSPGEVFKDIVISYKSVCIVTKDQDPIPSSPTCFYEFDLRYCPNGGFETACRNGRFTAHGSGPDKLRIAGGSDDFFGAFGQVRDLVIYPFIYHFSCSQLSSVASLLILLFLHDHQHNRLKLRTVLILVRLTQTLEIS